MLFSQHGPDWFTGATCMEVLCCTALFEDRSCPRCPTSCTGPVLRPARRPNLVGTQVPSLIRRLLVLLTVRRITQDHSGSLRITRCSFCGALGCVTCHGPIYATQPPGSQASHLSSEQLSPNCVRSDFDVETYLLRRQDPMEFYRSFSPITYPESPLSPCIADCSFSAGRGSRVVGQHQREPGYVDVVHRSYRRAAILDATTDSVAGDDSVSDRTGPACATSHSALGVAPATSTSFRGQPTAGFVP